MSDDCKWSIYQILSKTAYIYTRGAHQPTQLLLLPYPVIRNKLYRNYTWSTKRIYLDKWLLFAPSEFVHHILDWLRELHAFCPLIRYELCAFWYTKAEISGVARSIKKSATPDTHGEKEIWFGWTHFVKLIKALCDSEREPCL